MTRMATISAALLLTHAGTAAVAAPDTPAPLPPATPFVSVLDDTVTYGSISGKMTNNEDQTVEVVIRGVDAEVTINGVSVGKFQVDGDWTERTFGEGDSTVRIVKRPGGLLTLEQNGSTMTLQAGGPEVFDVGSGPLVGQEGVAAGRAVWALNNSLNTARGMMLNEEPPKVMLGVTMSRPDADAVRAAGFDPAKTTRLGSVMDGLPAANAGLREGDIIVGIGDSDQADQETIRERLTALNPGDVLTFKVLRDGKVTLAGVKLEAYDAERLGVRQQVLLQGNAWFDADDTEINALRERQADVKEKYAQARKQALSADDQRARERFSIEAEKLNAELQNLTAQIAKKVAERTAAQFFVAPQFQGAQVLQWNGGDMMVVPQAPAAGPMLSIEPMIRRLTESEQLLRRREARIEELETRLDAMTSQLQHLEAMLTELTQQKDD